MSIERIHTPLQAPEGAALRNGPDCGRAARPAALAFFCLLAVLLLSGTKAQAADWTYDPYSAMPSGTYENIIDFDGLDSRGENDLRLKLEGGATVTLGGAVPFTVYDKDGNAVARETIKSLTLFSDDQTAPTYVTIGEAGADESWSVPEGGSLVVAPGVLLYVGNGGTGEFTVNSDAHTHISSGLAVGGFRKNGSMTINGGGNLFNEVLLGPLGGSGDLTIEGGHSIFGLSSVGSLAVGGRSSEGGLAGGEGVLTISGGTNHFRQNVQVGGQGSSVVLGTAGGAGNATISDGRNVFSGLYLGGSGGGSLATWAADSGDGALTVSGGDTTIHGDSSIGVAGVGGGRKGSNASLVITGGRLSVLGTSTERTTLALGGSAPGTTSVSVNVSGGVLNLAHVDFGVRNGAYLGSNSTFTLGSDAILAAERTRLSAGSITLNGTLSLNLRGQDSAEGVLVLAGGTNGLDFSGMKMDIAAFEAMNNGGGMAYLLLTSQTMPADIASTTPLTVNGVPVTQTRANGAALQLGGGSYTLFLNNVPKTGIVYWEGTTDSAFDLTTSNWDTATENLGSSGLFLSGDRVEFGAAGYAQEGDITIADTGVAPDVMSVLAGDWTFSGGPLQTNLLSIYPGAGVGFDTRTITNAVGVVAIGPPPASGDRLKVTLYALEGETLTFAGAQDTQSMGVQLMYSDLIVGKAGGTMVFSTGNSGIGPLPTAGGAVTLAAGENRFLANSAGAVAVSEVTIAGGTNLFSSNFTTTSGGALQASVSTMWDTTFLGRSGRVAITGGENTFINNAALSDSNGGAIYAEKNLSVTGGTNTFRSNLASGKGGAIYAGGDILLIAKDGDMIFEGNLDKDGPNALYLAGAVMNLGAGEGKTLAFHDPIESTDQSVATIDIGYDNADSWTGTVLFDREHSRVRGNTTVLAGAMRMTRGATYGADKTDNPSFALGSAATLLADAAGNTVTANAISLANYSTIQLDMTEAVDKSEAGATTNLILDGNTVTVAANGKVTVDAINLSGLAGTYRLIQAGSLNFAGKYTGTVNGEDVASLNPRYGRVVFDHSTAGLLLLTQAEADVARIATWKGGSGTWDERGSMWNLSTDEAPNPENWQVFKNSDHVVFNASNSADNAITVDATGDSTHLTVQSMTIRGSNNWAFSGDGIMGISPGGDDADFTMNGSGTVTLGNDTYFSNYLVNSGVLTLGAGSKHEGDARVNAAALNLDSDAELTGDVSAKNSPVSMASGAKITGDVSANGGDVTMGAGAMIAGAVSATSGDLSLASGANITGAVVMNKGNLTLAVDANIIGAVGMRDGAMSLASGANVTGNVLVRSGDLILSPGASLTGDAVLNDANLEVLLVDAASARLLRTAATATTSTNATATLTGNLTLNSGSTYKVYVDPADQSRASHLEVTGKASLGGATVKHMGLDGEYAKTGTWTILSASEIEGTFASKVDTSEYRFLKGIIGYNGDLVTLTLQRDGSGGGKFSDYAKSFNQRRTAGALDRLNPNSRLYSDLAGIAGKGRAIRRALDQMSGEMYSSLSVALTERERALNRLLRNRALNGLPARTPGPNMPLASGQERPAYPLWISMDGYAQESYSAKGTADATLYGFNLNIGAERLFGNWLIGGAFQYGRSRFEVDKRGDSEADINSFNFAGYGGRSFDVGGPGVLRFTAGTSFGIHTVDAERRVSALRQKLKSDYNVYTWQISGEAGYKLPVGDITSLEPYLGLGWNTIWNDSFTEKGGSARLRVKSEQNGNLFNTAGLRVLCTPTDKGAIALDLGWLHTYGPQRHEYGHRFTSGPSFNIKGAPISRDAMTLGLEATYKMAPNMSLKAAYDGMVGDRGQSHGGRLSFTYEF